MQKFVVKKSKSAPPPPPPSSSLSSSTISQDPSALSTASGAATAAASTTAPMTTTTNNNLSGSVPATATATTAASTSQSSASPSPSSTGTTQVKMSGYLKKKRNKMGGWRKLWFVLQNQLLLSYSSKEDYERKLAPFKDVLNLVPGTIIRPTSGPRFIIETSTCQINTYRCDNNKVCSEWITALVESLAPHPNGSDVTIPLVSSKFHFSMENLPKSMVRAPPTSAFSSPASSFLSSRSCDSLYRAKYAKQTAKLPVAQNTARLLERVAQLNKKELSRPQRSTEKVQNFRLHHNDLHVNQCFEVHRINRMFSNNNASNCGGGDGGAGSKFDQSNLNNNNKRIERNYGNAVVADDDDAAGVPDEEIPSDSKKLLDKNSNRGIFTMDSLNRNSLSGNCSLIDQFQHISLGNSSLGSSPASSTASTTSKHSSNATAELRASISKMFQTQVDAHDVNLITAYDDEAASNSENSSKSSTEPMPDQEPIYAVVNLKNKYARRAHKTEIDENIFAKDRPNSFHVISGDYEEVLHLDGYPDGTEDDENIYEPINIPDMNVRNPLWRYFSKINIDALVEITRRKKDHPKDECATSAFSDIRKRFGNHRKSLKNRMKKFYHRRNSDPNDANENCSDDADIHSQHVSCSPASSSGGKSTPDVNGDKNDGGQFRKRERHIFGSMLKKSRTSLCLDDSAAPRKKLIMALGSGGAGLKRRFNRSFEDKKPECHSKFYD